jgi:hypothetical protein
MIKSNTLQSQVKPKIMPNKKNLTTPDQESVQEIKHKSATDFHHLQSRMKKTLEIYTKLLDNSGLDTYDSLYEITMQLKAYSIIVFKVNSLDLSSATKQEVYLSIVFELNHLKPFKID